MRMDSQDKLEVCWRIINAYKSGALGSYSPPESIVPGFSSFEDKLRYYTLPMALNYRRQSGQLWEAAKTSYEDTKTRHLYDLAYVSRMSLLEVQDLLSIHHLAMQPVRHSLTWKTIAENIYANWGSIEKLLYTADKDFLVLKELVQFRYKKAFPYLSGPKIFNFWCFILSSRCNVIFQHGELIDIAVDGHIRRSSAQIGIVTLDEAQSLPAEAIAQRWRSLLHATDIRPVDLNIPLWYWSRNKFRFNSE